MTRALQRGRFWTVTVAAVLAAGLTFSLGQWQLRRAAHKEALHAAIEQQNKLPALDIRSLLAINNIANTMHRRAVLTGHWQAAQTVYLDNRPMNGKPGFWVLTPLLLDGSDRALLVQRGWIPRDFQDRSRLASISTPVHRVQVAGRIAPAPSKLYEFAGLDSGQIRQNLDIAGFRTETGLPLLDALLLQTGAASEGLSREWTAPNTGVDKHYGYAFQWFGLAGLVTVLYIWFQFIVPRRSSRPASRRAKSPT